MGQLNIGDEVFKYTLRRGELRVHKGVVYMDGGYESVKFGWREYSGGLCPREHELGIIMTDGPNLWLTDRDDELAARIFLEYEEQKLIELKKQVEVKKELISMLKRDLV